MTRRPLLMGPSMDPMRRGAREAHQGEAATRSRSCITSIRLGNDGLAPFSCWAACLV